MRHDGTVARRAKCNWSRLPTPRRSGSGQDNQLEPSAEKPGDEQAPQPQKTMGVDKHPTSETAKRSTSPRKLESTSAPEAN